jgi:hypothetical protein
MKLLSRKVWTAAGWTIGLIFIFWFLGNGGLEGRAIIAIIICLLSTAHLAGDGDCKPLEYVTNVVRPESGGRCNEPQTSLEPYGTSKKLAHTPCVSSINFDSHRPFGWQPKRRRALSASTGKPCQACLALGEAAKRNIAWPCRSGRCSIKEPY